jgi:carbamoyltransferase
VAGAPPLTYVDHYRAHLGNAVFLSPYDECAVLLLDGRAERQTGLLARARGADVEVFEEICFPHSLGMVYGAVTEFLGYRPDSDEWKVMALAAYADADNEYLEPMRRLIHVEENGTFSVALEYFAYYNFSDPRWYSDRFVRVFGPPRTPQEAISERHMRIAAALQRVFEESITRILHCLHRRAGLPKLAVSGGWLHEQRLQRQDHQRISI